MYVSMYGCSLAVVSVVNCNGHGWVNMVSAQTEGDTGYDYNDAYDDEYDDESGETCKWSYHQLALAAVPWGGKRTELRRKYEM